MTLQEIIDIWEELHVKDTGELGFCDLANAVREVVGITNNEGVKVFDLDPAKAPPLSKCLEELEKWIMELRNQQPNP